MKVDNLTSIVKLFPGLLIEEEKWLLEQELKDSLKSWSCQREWLLKNGADKQELKGMKDEIEYCQNLDRIGKRIEFLI